MTMVKIMMKMIMMMTMIGREVESGDRIRPLRGRFGRPPLHTLLSICALPLKSHSLEFISGEAGCVSKLSAFTLYSSVRIFEASFA